MTLSTTKLFNIEKPFSNCIKVRCNTITNDCVNDNYRILAIVQGEWGERIVGNIKTQNIRGWIIETLKLPRILPQIIDDANEILPNKLPITDLVLVLGETPQVGQLIQEIVKKTNAKSVICPIDNNSLMSPGMKNQLIKEFKALGVVYAFPKPFCSLIESGDIIIDRFTKRFGKPYIKIKCSNVIESIDIVRGAPCGSTYHMAKECIGIKVEDSKEKCALSVHHYPCLASMDMDPELNDTIMHKSGFIIMDEVERAIIEYLKRNPWKMGQIIPADKRA